MSDEAGFQRRPRGLSLGAGIVVSMLTSAAMFFGLREIERRGLFEGKKEPGVMVVPDVVGMTGDQARELLQGRGLRLSLNSKRADARVPAGSVAEQTPLAGSQIEAGAEVRAVMSTGPIAVPDVKGADADEAARRLLAAGLLVGTRSEQPSDSVPAGKVAGTDPPSGSPLGAGASVALVLSSGPPTRAVPQVVGLGLTAAKKALLAAGFVLGTVRAGYSDYKDEGVILSQIPEADKPAAPGSKVDIVINRVDQ